MAMPTVALQSGRTAFLDKLRVLFWRAFDDCPQWLGGWRLVSIRVQLPWTFDVGKL